MTVAAIKRQCGVGGALLAHAMELARDNDRALVTGPARLGSPGEAFARAAGAQIVMTRKRYVLDISGLSPTGLIRLRGEAEQRSAGYSLVSWTGGTPDAYLDQVADLTDIISDAPRPEGKDEYHWGIRHVKDTNKRIIRQGLRYYTTAVRDAVSGRLAGLTQIAIAPEHPDWGRQELTVVARDHRGHRLGLLLKTALLQKLVSTEPQLRFVMTGTADANTYMNAVNELIGYKMMSEWVIFSLPATDGTPG